MKKKDKKSGGKRAGAGRKSKYGEPTEQMTHRVPTSKKNLLCEIVKKKLKTFEK